MPRQGGGARPLSSVVREHLMRRWFAIICLVPTCVVASSIAYFPEGTLHESSVAWYSKALIAADEPSLSAQLPANGVELYRFTWLRTFHAPIILRLEVRPDGVGILRAKRTNGAGGYEPGVLDLNQASNVSASEVAQFKKALEGFGFWNSPTEDSRMGVDGAEWIFEGVTSTKYHVVTRWTPDDGPFRRAMLNLLRMSGVHVDRVY